MGIIGNVIKKWKERRVNKTFLYYKVRDSLSILGGYRIAGEFMHLISRIYHCKNNSLSDICILYITKYNGISGRKEVKWTQYLE